MPLAKSISAETAETTSLFGPGGPEPTDERRRPTEPTEPLRQRATRPVEREKAAAPRADRASTPPEKTLRALERVGVGIEPEGADGLRLSGPTSRISPSLRSTLKVNKAGLVALLGRADALVAEIRQALDAAEDYVEIETAVGRAVDAHAVGRLPRARLEEVARYSIEAARALTKKKIPSGDWEFIGFADPEIRLRTAAGDPLANYYLQGAEDAEAAFANFAQPKGR